MSDYLPLVVMFVLALAFTALSFVASGLLAPRRPSSAKRAPYESGIVPSREPPERFPVKFYLVTMIFIMFDVEIIFLFPWAVLHRDLGGYGLWAMLIFVAIFFLSFLYEISMGGLDWGPVRRDRRVAPLTAHDLPPRTTVRRVGLEGREVAA